MSEGDRLRLGGRLLGSLTAVASGAALAGACGGDSEALSRADYIARGDAICERQAAELRKVKPPRTPQEAATASEQEARARGRAVDEMKELKAPPALEADVEAFIGASERIVENLGRQAELARRNQQGAYSALALRNTFERIPRTEAARRIGFKRCGMTAPGADPELTGAADRICREADEAIIAATPPDLRPDDLDRLAAAYDRSLPAVRESVRKLRALRPSAKDRAAYREFLAAYAERIALTGRQRAAARADDEKRFEAVTRQDEAAHAREEQAAARLGFNVCGAAGSSGV